jgi:large subunit ribosomal protein L15
MQLHDLHPAPGSRRERTRVGRGISAGKGKTAGRGQKGQFSRSSVSLPHSFEGGQMPLSQRLPKLRGFHNRFRRDIAVVNVGKLNRFSAGTVVDEAALREAGLVARARDGVKLLNAGRLEVALTVRVHHASKAALATVEAAGGSVELLATKPVAAADAAPAAAAEPVVEPEAEPPAQPEAAAAPAAPARPRSRARKPAATEAQVGVDADAEAAPPAADTGSEGAEDTSQASADDQPE